MNLPTMCPPRHIDADIHVLPAWLPVPGLDLLPVNAFVLTGREPVLVDTGLAALREDFLGALRTIVDPADIRWIWLSHMDVDHTGNLQAMLDRAPNARIVTGFLGMGKMMLAGLPVDRVQVIAPGETLSAGDRVLEAVRPPYYDAPETLGFAEHATNTFFAADAFGALLKSEAENAGDIPIAELRTGIARWSAIDAPWLAGQSAKARKEALRAVTDRAPSLVLSGHLPPATRMSPVLADAVHAACRFEARSAA